MRYTTARLAFAMLAALLPAAPASADPVKPAAYLYPCTFEFHRGLPYTQSGAVIAGGYAECIDTPEQFHISLTLQFRERGKGWIVQAAEHSETIPNPRLNVAVAAYDCVPGAWRGVADMWVTVNGQYTTATVDTAPVIISC
ncbi:hypothetical protein [Nocardia otitidiscaviarum]|uniref:hypothetical protein n=1 Tax=Nocardia otitidiscaviarum TaxID=1823 RepID=UPI0004A6FFD9|nr:hypothetical protein [Nocardia otitidiscaviarum]